MPAGPSPVVAGVALRLMQPNLPQDAKFNGRNGEAILNRYLELSDRATSPTTPGLQRVTHLIWPESAFPFLLGREPRALARIAAVLPPDVTLITGAARAGETLPGESRPPTGALMVMSEKGIFFRDRSGNRGQRIRARGRTSLQPASLPSASLTYTLAA